MILPFLPTSYLPEKTGGYCWTSSAFSCDRGKARLVPTCFPSQGLRTRVVYLLPSGHQHDRHCCNGCTILSAHSHSLCGRLTVSFVKASSLILHVAAPGFSQRKEGKHWKWILPVPTWHGASRGDRVPQHSVIIDWISLLSNHLHHFMENYSKWCNMPNIHLIFWS